MTEIKNVENYQNLSMSCLVHMLKNFKNVYFEEKKPIVFAITKKYFEDKNSVDLYDLILYHFKFRVLEERLNYTLMVLGKELDGDMNDLPVEYRENFFRVLLDFLGSVENYAKSQNGAVEWQLANIPKLLDYLSEVENSDITSYSLRQKINALVGKIKEDFEKAKENVKSENSLVVVKGNTLSEKETEEKLNQIKTLKLKKSNLNKGNLCDALSSFELYNDEDKAYLVNFMFKRNWTDCVSSIKDVEAFDYFCKNSHFCALSESYNPFRILMGSFVRLQSNFSESALRKWKEYFGASTFDELMNAVEKWYKSFEGTTELGWDCYKKRLMGGYLSNTRTYFMDSTELADYCKKLLLSESQKYLDFFIPYRGKTLEDWVSKVKCIPETICVEPPTIKDRNVIVENLKSIEEERYLICYYYSIYKKYDDKLFNYHGGFTNISKIDFDPLVINTVVFEDFINILKMLVFDGEMLVRLKENKKINWAPYGDWGSEDKVKNSVMNFIQTYFCQMGDSLTDEQIRDLWFNKEHYYAFCFFTDYHHFSGAFHGQDDYSYFFFNRLKDTLNFANIEDLKLVYRLKWNNRVKSKLYTEFYEKFKNECPECYNILNTFIGGKVEGQEGDIADFIKLYYEIG